MCLLIRLAIVGETLCELAMQIIAFKFFFYSIDFKIGEGTYVRWDVRCYIRELRGRNRHYEMGLKKGTNNWEQGNRRALVVIA